MEGEFLFIFGALCASVDGFDAREDEGSGLRVVQDSQLAEMDLIGKF